MATAARCGLILLGNSGVGKSFLANRLLDDDEAFESRFSARSVTRHTEWKDMSTVIGKHIYSVANIPGLVEANQKLIDENRREIMKAFQECPLAVVLFVFGHKNGRIPDEDLVAFMRINDAYEFPSQSLLLIVNGIPSNRPDEYEEKTAELLQELTHVDKSHIYFIEKTTSEKNNRDTHDLLHEAVAKCEPTYHTMKHDIELLADEISRLKMESKQRQDQLLTQEYEYSKKQKLNLTPDSIHERHRVPTQQSHITTTKEIHKSTIDRNTEFQQLMESNKAKHEQYMASVEGLINDSNRDYIKQFSQQLENVNKQNSALIAQISQPPPVIVVSKNQRENSSKGIRKAIKKKGAEVVHFVGDVFLGDSQSRESEHHRTSHQNNNQRNFQPSASGYLNPQHQNPNNN
jgi:predicted GTPase